MIRMRQFGTMPDGTKVQAWDLSDGIEVTVLPYGARIASVKVRVGGQMRRVVLEYPDLAGYLVDRSHQGAIAGRYANRIRDASFTLDGKLFQLTANNGPNCLHGGARGFGVALWTAERDDDTVVLRLESPDGDQGFPGRLNARICYAVVGNALRMDAHVTTDAPTVVNLANHAYFNLQGDGGSILDHVVRLAADRFTPVDPGLIPTGELRPVDGTPFDFRAPARVGDRINANDEQLRLAGGFDHNFVLGEQPKVTPELAATVAAGGLEMQVLTTQPGVQFYTGNFLTGAPFPYRGGLCLETQHFPDSPNQPSFPTTVLRPGTIFSSTTLYRFARL